MADGAIEAVLLTDPCCPWGYSANPALRLLEWRYADQLRWRLVMIGLTERPEEYLERGFTPARFALSALYFRRYGMPFAPAPKARVVATAMACRAVVATRLLYPRRALAGVAGVDPARVVEAIGSPEVEEAYQRDREEARSAAGSPSELQGKTATASDGRVRYTAPSLLLLRDGRRLEAGGFQPPEAYDVLIANLDPTLRRRGPAESAAAALAAFPEGLTSQEVAQLLAGNNEQPDRGRAEAELVSLVAEGKASRTSLGDDALWRPVG